MIKLYIHFYYIGFLKYCTRQTIAKMYTEVNWASYTGFQLQAV